jgi:TetR/AcrR family transcriptional regulator, cholesterol catabolism regulator
MDIRERIIEGAADLFRKYGIKSVTMDNIAGHIGMSKRTIYEVFSDKEELLMGVMGRMVEKQKELVRKLLDESENPIIAFFRLIEINRDHFQGASPAFQEDMKRFHHDMMIRKNGECEIPDFQSSKEVIEKGIREKLFREDIDPDIVNRCLFSLISSVMNEELYPYEEFTRKEVISNTIINYMRGISTNKGISLINDLHDRL